MNHSLKRTPILINGNFTTFCQNRLRGYIFSEQKPILAEPGVKTFLEDQIHTIADAKEYEIIERTVLKGSLDINPKSLAKILKFLSNLSNFLSYNQNVSNHKPHVLFIPGKIQEMIAETLIKDHLKPESIGDLVKSIENLNKMQENDCTKCKYKRENTEKPKDLGDFIREYLGKEEIIDESKLPYYKTSG
ncbi:MAG: hypothetical protein C3F06_10115 [Candidatus Methanoperedenaceae archaeon]|nr:MAG: hypothetical protein C3F06_10115 [Candidatus Methanoperedenaceae archaeon]